MGEEKKRLPVGLENFEQIINDNYYYVDKTGLISELIRNGGMVNLFTRPRRFGKTLNMSMLEHFFSIERDQSIFEGLKISKDTKLCEEYMGKYPVISISLKGINAATYEDAFDFAVQIMQRTAEEFQFLSDSEYLSEHDKSVYRELLDSNMSETVFCGGLKILSKLLEKHYRLKVILLIDEYDVPLAEAFENGYYEQMIFQDYVNVFPENYWINTSSNDAVKKFIQMSDNLKTKREIETLLAGGEIIKEIHQELIYPEMYQSLENVWSLLFMTGYLTQRGRVDAKRYKLAIPNLEIRDIFETQIMEYFKESVAKDGDTLSRFCDALKNGEETKIGEIFESYLKKTISIRDTFVRKASKENFYHGILLGILGVKEEWYVSSNQESGEGYSDIMVETENSETVILIEVKYANDGNLDRTCERALQQIEEKKYDEELRENGVDKILKYGIACYRKHCKVKQAEE